MPLWVVSSCFLPFFNHPCFYFGPADFSHANSLPSFRWSFLILSLPFPLLPNLVPFKKNNVLYVLAVTTAAPRLWSVCLLFTLPACFFYTGFSCLRLLSNMLRGHTSCVCSLQAYTFIYRCQFSSIFTCLPSTEQSFICELLYVRLFPVPS